jgi:hypothetical protein
MSKLDKAVAEDFLDEDPEIPSQKYALLSFLSPNSVLEKKELFFFERFLQQFEIDWRVKGLEKFIADFVISVNHDLDENAVELEKKNMHEQAEICRKNRVRIEECMDRLKQFIAKERKSINHTTIVEAYNDYHYKEGDKLEEEFHAKNDFTTTMRGVKVRGVYSSAKEAEARGKKLQQKDKYFNIFIGEVGKWLPWDPAPHKVQEQEYAEDQLNTLMKKYKENEDNREKFFDERRKDESTKGTVAEKPSTKRVFGVKGDETEITTTEIANNIFDTVGDLALARKQAAGVTGNRGEGGNENDNSVVTPRN